MKRIDNIKPSDFHHGQYVGYGAGTRWNIIRTKSSSGRWLATPKATGVAALDARREYAFTLVELGRQLQALPCMPITHAGA